VLAGLADRYVDIRLSARESGESAALRTGLGAIRGACDHQDADLEYDPAEFGVMLAPILSGKADVHGSAS
jgi:hypothetical protein